MKLHAINSTSFRLLYRSTIRINTALIFAAPSQKLKNITLSPFRKLVRPVLPSDIPGDQYLPARRYASAGYRDRNVSVRPSVRLSVCLSRAGIVSKRRKLAA